MLAVRKPNYGYGISQEIKEITCGHLKLGAKTLYEAIHALEKKDWIEVYNMATNSRKKKEYLITQSSKTAFATECKRLEELLMNAKLMENDDQG